LNVKIGTLATMSFGCRMKVAGALFGGYGIFKSWRSRGFRRRRELNRACRAPRKSVDRFGGGSAELEFEKLLELDKRGFHFRLSANKEFCQHDEVPSNWNYGNCISNELESDSEREERIHFFYGSGISRTAINHISVSMQIRRDQNQTHQYKFGFC